MLLEHIQNAEIRRGLQVKRERERDNKTCHARRLCDFIHTLCVRVHVCLCLLELVGVFVQISNYKISVIQFRSLAYKCLVVMSAAKAVVQIRTVW